MINHLYIGAITAGPDGIVEWVQGIAAAAIFIVSVFVALKYLGKLGVWKMLGVILLGVAFAYFVYNPHIFDTLIQQLIDTFLNNGGAGTN